MPLIAFPLFSIMGNSSHKNAQEYSLSWLTCEGAQNRAYLLEALLFKQGLNRDS